MAFHEVEPGVTRWTRDGRSAAVRFADLNFPDVLPDGVAVVVLDVHPIQKRPHRRIGTP